MAKSARKTQQKSKAKPLTVADLDLDPHAWARFEQTIKNAAKIGHKPHKPAKARPK